MITAKEVAKLAVKALDSKKGIDLKLLEITDVSTLADYFLICTASSRTHVRTLCDAVEEAMDTAGEPVIAAVRGSCWTTAAWSCMSLPRKRARFMTSSACGRTARKSA